MLNPCVQCGKERIDGKSWKEKNGSSVIEHTSTICPDSDCQKLVENAIEDRKMKAEIPKIPAVAKSSSAKLDDLTNTSDQRSLF